MRLLLSVAGVRNYQVSHYDIKTAFLNGKLDEEIYLKAPKGFEQGNKVYRLKKSLYGLKQAAHVWNQTLHNVLIKNGCVQDGTDKCLYKRESQGNVCYLIIHVDDILVASSNERSKRDLMEKVAEEFELKDLGCVKHYLGIDVERNNEGEFLISQGDFIDKVVKEADLEDAKTSKFPMDTGYFSLEGKFLDSNDHYRKLIGMLLYLSTNTRPDIAASVSILSRMVGKPRDIDMNELKRVIKYLKGTRNHKLKLNSKEGKEYLEVYSDANWAEDRVDRKSNSGYVCIANGGTVSWCSKKQNVVALSSTEAEYIALTETCKELTWLKEVAKGLAMELPETTIVKTDSQSCMAIVSNQKFSNRTKHIDARYHYIKDQVNEGKISLEYCRTEVNAADLLTKPLGSSKIESLRKLAGLVWFSQ
jgi:hypothetical protein